MRVVWVKQNAFIFTSLQNHAIGDSLDQLRLIPRPDNGGEDVDEEASCVAPVLTSDLCIYSVLLFPIHVSWLIFWGKTTKKTICFFSGFSIHFCVFDAFWIRFDFTPKNSVEIFFSLTLAGFLDFGGLGLGSWQLVHQAVGDHFRPFFGGWRNQR